MGLPDFTLIPGSAAERVNFSKQLHNLRADLALYYGQDLISASHLRVSEAQAFFECQPFENWKKGKENESKGRHALLGGINTLIKGMGVLAKILASSATRR